MSATEARPAAFQAAAVPQRIPWGFAEVFIISQTALPALLYLPGTQSFRLLIRFSAFAISLAAFAWYQVESKADTPRSLMQPWVAAVMSLLALMLFHPGTSSLAGGVAHMAVYFAVMAPLFWAPEFVKSPEQLARVLWILLLCSGANAVVGVLQVYDPARWLPAEFSRVSMAGVSGLGAVTYIGPEGQRIVRPPGLFDTPGAVAGPGYSRLLGLVFAVARSPVARARSRSSGAGACRHLFEPGQVSLRTTVVMTVYTLVAFRQGAARSNFGILSAGVVDGAVAPSLGGTPFPTGSIPCCRPLAVPPGARDEAFTFLTCSINIPRRGPGTIAWRPGISAPRATSAVWAEIGSRLDDRRRRLMVALYLGALTSTTASQWRIASATHFPTPSAARSFSRPQVRRS